MIQGPDAQYSQFLNDLATINSRLSTAQRQISSGKRINDISDSPDQISQLLSLRSQLGGVQQIQSNLNLVQTEVDTAAQTLNGAVTGLDRVLSLGAEGATGTASADSRKTLAAEVQDLLGQLVNAANTQVAGRYIFSGDADQAAPYTIDLTQNPPVSAYQGSPSTRQVQHPAGQLFSIAKTADEIFDNSDPTRNVFQSVTALRDALNNNDTAAINTAVANVRTASTHLNNMEAFYGGVQNEVSGAQSFAGNQVTLLKTQISSVEDADITSAIVELSQDRLTQQAALSAESERPRTSLFDFLK